MSDLSEFFMNPKSFAEKYFLLSSLDMSAFKEYLRNFHYNNGEIVLDTKNTYVKPSNYTNGVLSTDNTKTLFFEDGVLDNYGNADIQVGIGTLRIE